MVIHICFLVVKTFKTIVRILTNQIFMRICDATSSLGQWINEQQITQVYPVQNSRNKRNEKLRKISMLKLTLTKLKLKLSIKIK